MLHLYNAGQKIMLCLLCSPSYTSPLSPVPLNLASQKYHHFVLNSTEAFPLASFRARCHDGDGDGVSFTANEAATNIASKPARYPTRYPASYPPDTCVSTDLTAGYTTPQSLCVSLLIYIYIYIFFTLFFTVISTLFALAESPKNAV